jgi:flagellar biogenesis protein FliO
MFFWIGVLVILVVFVGCLTWGLRGFDERQHRPGTRRLR